jgi:hypothetical protein
MCDGQVELTKFGSEERHQSLVHVNRILSLFEFREEDAEFAILEGW